MSELLEAARLLREARRLVERAQPLLEHLPEASGELEVVRQALGQLGGDDRPDDAKV